MPTATSKSNDFDLGPEPDQRYIERKVLGTPIRLFVGAHQYNLARILAGDEDAAMDLMRNIVVPEDWKLFNDTIGKSAHFKSLASDEARDPQDSPLVKLLTWMIAEVSEGKASKLYSDLSTGSTKKVAKPRSKAGSASTG